MKALLISLALILSSCSKDRIIEKHSGGNILDQKVGTVDDMFDELK
ncbi:MAG: hypothetical protein ISQ32_00915 [Rickettsiales bacterium]|nr:hypothetical protein [Rickettsiales bacterium]